MFAALLAVVTCRHEMYLDEVQAWLIARDSRNLLELAWALRYEGHPIGWYLLIYLPSHLSSNVVWMQSINYALALGMAGLILSERRLPFAVRLLTIFSMSVFFYMGVIARSYMLANVLLIAAARCLLTEQRRHWLAMALLSLAINSHFFAIPFATGIFVWLYWFAPVPAWSVAVERLRQRRFWISAAILGFALAACFFTLRPAPDLYTPQYQFGNPTAFGNLVLGVGSVWQYFVPFPWDTVSASAKEMLAPRAHPSLIAATLTICLWLLALSVLSARRSRWFMISVSLLWTATVWATVHVVSPLHTSFLFVGYVIALMMDSPDQRGRSWMPAEYTSLTLLILLGIQVSICLHASVEECLYPFSGSESTAKWLESEKLTQRPLAIEPDLAAPAILGYNGIRSAYLPTCRCRGSFVVFRKGRDTHRQITIEELRALHRDFDSPPVVISAWKISGDSLQRLRLKLLYESPQGWLWDDENVFVYEWIDGATSAASVANR